MDCCIFEKLIDFGAHVAQSVERILGKDEVTSSILVMGSIKSCYKTKIIRSNHG